TPSICAENHAYNRVAESGQQRAFLFVCGLVGRPQANGLVFSRDGQTCAIAVKSQIVYGMGGVGLRRGGFRLQRLQQITGFRKPDPYPSSAVTGSDEIPSRAKSNCRDV